MTGPCKSFALHAFSIDIQSVLMCSSQNRAESMLVRLAHMQDYLMLSPSREQVCSW